MINNSECRDALNIASENDILEISLPKNFNCKDVTIEMNFSGNICRCDGLRDNYFHDSVGEEKYNYTNNLYFCLLTFKNAYDSCCCPHYSGKKNCIETDLINNKFDIKIGYSESYGQPYLFNKTLKVIHQEDLEKECKIWNFEKTGINVGIPLIIISGICSIIGFYLSKKGKTQKLKKIGTTMAILGVIITIILAVLNRFKIL
ncbi:MAG: hypothetical protein JSW08_02465 [archaeon]|nr:MAG: hypothetical protein JSW08_02465 [archaeon]